MRTTPVTITVIFQKCHSEKLVDQSIKVFNNYEAKHALSFLGAKFMKRKLTKVPGKLSVAQNSEPGLRRKLQENRR